ncbi:transposase [Providencia alcalifaciens PAL-3]|nr:transposase [Providencia alcalifaciens PAL-3]EUC99218.1 transposase [Providencia alcalifaciens PAL-1]
MTKKLSKKNETTIIRFSAVTVAEVMMKNPILLKLRSIIFSIFTDSGMKVEDICRQNGISNATYYNWKSKYGGREANDVKRLKELEEENIKLKKLFAEVSLENHAMKELFAKKSW